MRIRAALLTGGLAATAIWSAALSTAAVPTAAAESNAATLAGLDPVSGAVFALTTEPADRAVAAIPDGFAARMGYTPVVDGGFVVDPSGDCSSPIPLPTEFDSACKAHDLGYDLLRYADATGRTLPATARASLDRQLDERMHDACTPRTESFSRATCVAGADVATRAVAVNSWRQDYGTPVEESVVPYAAGTALVLGIALTGVAALPFIRITTRHGTAVTA